MSELRIPVAWSRRQLLESLTAGSLAAWLDVPDFIMAAGQPFAEKSQTIDLPTAFYYHPTFLKHDPGSHHPECPQRLTRIIERLKADRLWEKLAHPEPKPANVETIAPVMPRSTSSLPSGRFRRDGQACRRVTLRDIPRGWHCQQRVSPLVQRH